LEKLQVCIGWLIDNGFGFGGELFASVSDERGQEANHGDGMSKEFHGVKCQAVAKQVAGCQEFVKRCKLSVHTGREETRLTSHDQDHDENFHDREG
jgi:hypothetical protein